MQKLRSPRASGQFPARLPAVSVRLVLTCPALSPFAAEGAPGERGVREGALSAHSAQRGPVRADHGDGLEEPSGGFHPHE